VVTSGYLLRIPALVVTPSNPHG